MILETRWGKDRGYQLNMVCKYYNSYHIDNDIHQYRYYIMTVHIVNWTECNSCFDSTQALLHIGCFHQNQEDEILYIDMYE